MRAAVSAVLFLCLGAIPAHAVPASLIGSQLSLRTIAQATPTSELFITSFPASAIVSASDVEFPDVASLFDPSTGLPPGFGDLVDVSIDAGANFLEIDFDNSAPDTQFASGFQNTYVFTFDSSVAVNIVNAEIDPLTTLGLSSSRISFLGNELFVNVQGLTFDTSTFARIDLVSELVSLSEPRSTAIIPGLALLAFLGLRACPLARRPLCLSKLSRGRMS